MDLFLAGTALALLSPVFALAALVVRLASPGPILFRQERIGLGGEPFTLLKFRTMRAGSDGDDRRHREFNLRELAGDATLITADGILKPEEDPRITPGGRLLRRFSIDELPQLLNVLHGEMSIVGPRPSLPWEVAAFTPEQFRRHDTLPGITGLWQVSGRNRLTMLQMLELDLAYVRCRSLRLDLAILARTPRAVLFDRETR